MEFFDTHCHIHEASADAAGDEFVRDKWAAGGFTDPRILIDNAVKQGVTRLLCVGCTLKDSQMAVKLVAGQPQCWASVGIHPHEAKDHLDSSTQKAFGKLLEQPKAVAIGECGLDFYYNHSSKPDQLRILDFQMELAVGHNLPMIFHVREAFKDFWSVYDKHKGIRGVIHSFSSTLQDLDQILSRGLYVGLNGIMTFTKNKEQLLAAKAIPLSSLLLETDAPFLTPAPCRGTICQPMHIVHTAEFLAELRNEDLTALAAATTSNAYKLFGLE